MAPRSPALTTGVQPYDAFPLGFNSALCRLFYRLNSLISLQLNNLNLVSTTVQLENSVVSHRRTPGNMVWRRKPCSSSTPSSGPHLSLFPLSDPSMVPSQTYTAPKITFGINGLANGGGAVGDPASLGVAPVMLGETSASYTAAGQSDIDYAVDLVPHWTNGAISQRVDIAELWCVTFFISHLSHIRWDFIYMLPPFLAYFSADIQNASLLETVYLHCGLYRSVLLFSSNTSDAVFRAPFTSPTNGGWHHIVWPQSAEPGLWSPGNGWAATGMACALATVIEAPVALYTTEIVDGARGALTDSGLLRNYLNDTTTGHGFGGISGTAL
ncbi:hypothetical protein C8R44DRAFT_865915 [Mycena epipterygia]|nr:hypothetical protein C8R44DRAFT_865915 [Mycena epipterygia]